MLHLGDFTANGRKGLASIYLTSIIKSSFFQE